jgi:hypothetical protein
MQRHVTRLSRPLAISPSPAARTPTRPIAKQVGDSYARCLFSASGFTVVWLVHRESGRRPPPRRGGTRSCHFHVTARPVTRLITPYELCVYCFAIPLDQGTFGPTSCIPDGVRVQISYGSSGSSRFDPFAPALLEGSFATAGELRSGHRPERVVIRVPEGAVVGKDLEVVRAVPAGGFDRR